ncbi:MAG: tRNA pseudouridine(38-40) synthase TruA [Candidatus Sumerlaea chitinivorans]|uniref:tRNA pseudouridine synthase A n=1 Tax=Sumerlaea chitinivorans TaxID=2250252 RepID=A0A2Z4Y7H7_SUMC1|nr:tRNA pseudouridine synthase A [Candidatus Sumerlaea chitinivorans]MCX7963918.1 tRNA pseudouridine(38-40) synthase TruA [Candidatus Sumerlaea chitinivorans]
MIGRTEKRVIRMTLEYDGTRYVGWQRQKNGVSVQEKVEEALSRHLGERIRVTAAGRTDSGVHALGQVISFSTRTRLSPHAIARGALPYLPRDIAILNAAEASPDFNARRHARLRWYRYFILNRSIAPAVGAAYLTHVPYRLDLQRMEAVAEIVAGHHDFRAFRAKTCTAVRTHLTLHKPEITLLPDGVLMLDFRCQSFLQNMVRILAGVMVNCARGKMSLDAVRAMLATGERPNEAVTLPPNGLFLYRVLYPGDPELEALLRHAPGARS